MDDKSISVYSTVRNGAGFLTDMVRSVFDGGADIVRELVLVDDGSTDATLQIALELAAHYPLNIVETRGVGRGQALQIAWRSTVAPLIANLDVDDQFTRHKLARQLAVLQKEPSAAVVATRCALSEAVTFENVNAAPRYARISSREFLRRNPICHSSVVIRKEWMVKVGGYDTTRRSQFDYDLWVRLKAAGAEFVVLDEPLTIRRLHPGQSFEVGRRLSYAASSVRLQARAVRDLEGPPSAYLWCGLRFAYSLLPRAVRLAMRGAIGGQA